MRQQIILVLALVGALLLTVPAMAQAHPALD